jgi:uncharacterized OsmC-like protein
MATTTSKGVMNGIDTEALRGLVGQIAEEPARGMTTWRVATHWKGGTRSDTNVSSYVIGGQEVAKDWTIPIDEPLEIGGTNKFANPQEYLLAAFNACQMVGYVALAALEGIELEDVRIEAHGDIDLRGFLGIDPEVAPGYRDISYTVYLKGNGTPEQFQKIHEMVMATAPNRYNLATAIALNSELVVE